MTSKAYKSISAARPGLVTTELRYPSHNLPGNRHVSLTLPKTEFCHSDATFFLASVDETRWVPRILAVESEGSVVGLVSVKERKIAGLRSGLIYADDTLGKMITAEPGFEEDVFEAGVRRLMQSPGTNGLRLLIPPDGYAMNVIERLSHESKMDVHCGRSDYHLELRLGGSYDSFLEGLGDKTRRNFRYYRRRFESNGHTSVSNISLDAFKAAAHHLEKLNVVGASRNGIDRAMRMLAMVKRPVLVGLRHKNGEWLSILGGWYEGDRVVVFIQMNNEQNFRQDSLCTVARGYLIESAIRDGYRSLIFWAGVGGPITRYCHPMPTIGVYLDSRKPLWRFARRVVALGSSLLPRRASELANWVTPTQSTI